MTTEIATARVVRRRGRGTTKIIAGATIAGLVLLMVLASFLLPGDPNKQVLMERLRPPVFAGGDWSHILGTDQLGRDMLLRLMHGGRVDVRYGGQQHVDPHGIDGARVPAGQPGRSQGRADRLDW